MADCGARVSRVCVSREWLAVKRKFALARTVLALVYEQQLANVRSAAWTKTADFYARDVV